MYLSYIILAYILRILMLDVWTVFRILRLIMRWFNLF